MRVESDYPVDCKGAGIGYLHRLDGSHQSARSYEHPSHRQNRNWTARQSANATYQPTSKPKPKYLAADLLECYCEHHSREWLNWWAAYRGVSRESLLLCSAVAMPSGTLLVPECNGSGEIVGINRLFPDSKIASGHRGLYLPDSPSNASGPLLIVEGFGDTTAALTLGFNAIGRPNASACIGEITEAVLLEATTGWNWNGEFVVVADAGDVGMNGAKRAAEHIAEVIGRRVSVVMPGAAADLREFLIDGRRDGKTIAEMRRELLLGDPIAEHEAKQQASEHGKGCGCGGCTRDNADVAELKSRGGYCKRCDQYADIAREATETKRAQFARVKLRCRCMSCPACRPLQLAKWLETMQAVTRTVGKLFAYAINGKNWQALHRKLKRAGGQFFRVRQSDPGEAAADECDVLVISDVEVGDDAVPVSPAEARRQLYEALRDSTCDRRPVSSSRDWQQSRKPTEHIILHVGKHFGEIESDAIRKAAAERKRLAKSQARRQRVAVDDRLYRCSEWSGQPTDDLQAGVAVDLGDVDLNGVWDFYASVIVRESASLSEIDCTSRKNYQTNSDKLPNVAAPAIERQVPA